LCLYLIAILNSIVLVQFPPSVKALTTIVAGIGEQKYER
jgi:hypothetical protein